MTNEIKAAGYMIQDNQGNAIFGIGSTVDEAWADVVEQAGPFTNNHGDEISADEAFERDYIAHCASAALIAEVTAKGGAIAWGNINGVACTIAEQEAASA